MITLAAIPLKNCRQCSHYRGGYCYGFGTAKQVFSESEALLCGTYTPLGQVQIGPLDSLAGQLVAYQIPSGLISTIKLADLAVTVAKLGLSSVINSKVAAGAAIVESKLSLVYGTQALHDDIQTRVLAAAYLAHDHSVADPTQVDHANLLNVLTSQHHVRYADAEAVAAVEAADPLNLAGEIDIAKNLTVGGGCFKLYRPVNDGHPWFAVGANANDRFYFQTAYNVGTQVVDKIIFNSVSTSATPEDGRFEFWPDGVKTATFHTMGGAYAGRVIFAGALTIDGVGGLALVNPLGPNPSILSNHATQRVDIIGGLAMSGDLTVSENILSANAINIKPSGDLDDYLEFRTAGGYPTTKIIGNHLWVLESSAATKVSLGFYENSAHNLIIGFDKSANKGILVCKDEIDIQPSDDIDNFIRVSTVADVPKIDNVGGNAIQIDGVDVSAEPARITAEIDADIATHAGLPSVHHTAYTDAMALAAVDEHLVLESENAEWINCPYEGQTIEAADKFILGGIHIPSGGYSAYSVPLPTTRGGKSLFISGTRVSLAGADGSNYVTSTYIHGMAASTKATLDTDPTDKNSVNLWEDTSMGALNCSGYHAIKVEVLSTVATQGVLKIQFITVRYYYA